MNPAARRQLAVSPTSARDQGGDEGRQAPLVSPRSLRRQEFVEEAEPEGKLTGGSEPLLRGLLACGLFSLSFLLDVVAGLPLMWREARTELLVELAFLALGGLVGAEYMAVEMGLTGKDERVPPRLRSALSLASAGGFAAAPGMVLAVAVTAFRRNNVRLLRVCRQACSWACGAGALPVVLVLMLQASAMSAHDINLVPIVAVGAVLLVVLAVEHDTQDHVYLRLASVAAHSMGRDVAEGDTWEESIPMVTGPLESVLCLRALLVAAFRLAEIVASVGAVVLFDAGTRRWLAVCGAGFGGGLLVVAQFGAQLLIFQQTSGWMTAQYMRAFVACAFVPKAVLDADAQVLEHYAVMLVTQALVTLGDLTCLDTPASMIERQVFGAAMLAMWPLLFAVRQLSSPSDAPRGAVELADKVRAGTVQLEPLTEDDAPRPQLLAFCRAFADQLFGSSFQASRGQLKLDLASCELEFAAVLAGLNLVAPLLADVTHFELDLEGCAISDSDIAELVEHIPQGLTRLELNLAGTKIGDVGSVTLAQRLPRSLQVLEAGFNSTQVTDKGLAVLAQYLPPGLTSLEAIFYNTKVGDRGVKALAQRLPRKLVNFRAGFYRTEVGDEGIIALAECLPETLTTFKADLSGCKVGDEGALALVQHLPEGLVTFEANVAGTKVSEEVKAQLLNAAPTFKGRVRPAAPVEEVEEFDEVPTRRNKAYCCILPWCNPGVP